MFDCGFEPQVAVAENGDAVFAWVGDDGSSDRAQARSLSAAGALGPVQNLSRAGRDAFSPGVAVDPHGHAVFTWLRSDGTSDGVQARTRSAKGALGAIHTLSPAGQSAGEAAVAARPDGEVAVIWVGYDGSNQRVQAAFGP
jgi:hypothetical protein